MLTHVTKNIQRHLQKRNADQHHSRAEGSCIQTSYRLGDGQLGRNMKGHGTQSQIYILQ
jgi:hypothetical protein